jgi:hypothetical protein
MKKERVHMKRNLSSFYHIGRPQEFLKIYCPRFFLKIHPRKNNNLPNKEDKIK